MSLLRVWIPGGQNTLPEPPMGVQYLVGTVSAKEIDP